MPFVPKRVRSTKPIVRTRPVYYLLLLLTILASGAYIYFRPKPQLPLVAADLPRPAVMATIPLSEKHEPRITLEVRIGSKELRAGEAFALSIRLKNGSDQDLSMTQILEKVVVGGQRSVLCVLPEDYRSEGRDSLWVKPGEEFEVSGLVSGASVLASGTLQVGFDGLNLDAKVVVGAFQVLPAKDEEEVALAFVTQYPDVLRGWKLERFTGEQFRVTSDFVSRFPQSIYAPEAWLTLARIYEIGISTYSSGKRVYTLRKDLEKSDTCLRDISNPALTVVSDIMRAAHAEERGDRDVRDEILKDLCKTHGNHVLFRFSRFCPK